MIQTFINKLKNIKLTVGWPLLILLIATSFLTITPKNVLANVYGGSNYGSGSYGQLGSNANDSTTTPATGSVSSTTTGTTSGSSPATSTQSSDSSNSSSSVDSTAPRSNSNSSSSVDSTAPRSNSNSAATNDTKTKNNSWSKVWIWLLGAFIVFDIVFVVLRFRRKRL